MNKDKIARYIIDITSWFAIALVILVCILNTIHSIYRDLLFNLLLGLILTIIILVMYFSNKKEEMMGIQIGNG